LLSPDVRDERRELNGCEHAASDDARLRPD
jgi:hypothetical protein